MKRRTFLQTVVGAIAAVFMPKPKEAKAVEVEWGHIKGNHPYKDADFQSPHGQLCLICDCEKRPVLRLVWYIGQKKIYEGSLVYYVDESCRTVTTGPQICFLDETEVEIQFAGVVKWSPEELRKRYIEGPKFKGVPLEYKESLDA